MRRRLASLLALVLLPSSTTTCAQKQVRFTFTGFVQAITQYDSESDYTRVSNITIPHDQPTTRMGIRRRRLAAIAAYGDLAARLEVNATEQKISIFNVYAEYKPHWAEEAFVKGGLMTPSFGYELPHNPNKRAAFKQSHYMDGLFPGGIDMGLAMGYNGTLDQSRRWRLESTLSVLSGNMDKRMNKNLLNLALRLALTKQDNNHAISFGLSGYAGTMPTPGGYYVFDKGTATFKKDRMLRTYGGAFLTSAIKHQGGQLILTTEGITDLQPERQRANLAVGAEASPTPDNDLFAQRPFIAGMAQIMERIKPVDLELFGRCAYYDRNRRFGPKTMQDVKLGQLSARAEGRSHRLSTGVDCFLQEDHLRLSLQYGYFLRQQIEQQALVATKSLHMMTAGAQYKF